MATSNVANSHIGRLLDPARLTTLLGLWRRRSRTRASLRKLEDVQLRDIGLTPLERHRECAKWFWEQ